MRDAITGVLETQLQTDLEALYFDIDQTTGRLFYSSTGRGIIGVMNLSDYTTEKKIDVATTVTHIHIHHMSGDLYLLDRLGGSVVYRVNPNTASLVGTLTPGNWPVESLIDDSQNRLYVLGHYESKVSVFDMATDEKVMDIPLGIQRLRTDQLSIMAMDHPSGKLYVVAIELGSLTMVNADGSGTPSTVAMEGYTPVGTGTGPGKIQIAINESLHQVYVFLRDAKCLNIYDGNSLSLLGSSTISGFSQMNSPLNLLFSDDVGARLFVGPYIINPQTGAVLGSISSGLKVIGSSPSRDRFYVMNYTAAGSYESILEYNSTFTTVLHQWDLSPILAGGPYSAFGFDFTRGKMYVGYFNTGVVDVFDIGGATNQPPVLDFIGNKTVEVGGTLTFTITATDPDNDPLTYTATSLPSGATFASQTLNWIPSQTGTYTICFEVSDGALTDSETITITVNKKEGTTTVHDFIFSVSMGNTAAARTDAELATAFQMLSDLGCTQTKWNFNWSKIETSTGHYDWARTDYIAGLAQQYNISIILFCNQVGIPPWGCKQGKTTVPDPDKYADFVCLLLNRYKDSMSIEYVELLQEISNGVADGVNEPYGSWDDTAAYAVTIGNAVYDKVHKDFPGVKVGPIGFSQPHGLSGSLTNENDIKDAFMEAYFSANPKMDFLPLHNYPHFGPTQIGNFTYATQYNQTDLYRGLLDNYGYNNTPIFITEGSLGTDDWGSDQKLYAAFTAQDCIIQYAKKDSGNLTGMVTTALANGLNSSGYNIVDVSTNTRYDGYYAFQTAKRILTKYPVCEGSIAGQPDSLNLWVEKFKDDEGNLLFVAFAPIQIHYSNPEKPTPRNYPYTEPQNLVLLITSNTQATVTSQSGTSSTVYSDNNGNIFLSIYKEPIFIEVSGLPSELPNVVITKKCRNITRRGEGSEYFEKETALSGEVIQYSITVKNTGKAPGTDVNIVDNIPDGLLYIEGSVTGPGAEVSDSKLKWKITAIPPEGSETLSFKAEVK